jgi:L-asparagine oxygenase
VDDSLPPTPLSGGSLPIGLKKTFVSEFMILSIGTLTDSEPFNFRQEGRGTAPLIDNIVPIKGLKTQKGAGGFDNKFPFHCESAWHRKRPDYLALLGVREAVDAFTLVFSAEMLNRRNTVQNNGALEGMFRLKSPELYLQMENAGIPLGTARYFSAPPIQFIEKNKIKLNINFNGTDCKNQTAVEWLSKFENFVESRAVGAVLAPGNALILNNNVTCHTRTSFSPSFEGMDRWFLRAYFKKDLWNSDKLTSTSSSTNIDSETLKRLIEVGWLTEDMRLTKKFLKYVYNPAEIMELDEETAPLASIAFNLTPVEGSRIV